MMSSEKYSPKLLRSILEEQGIEPPLLSPGAPGAPQNSSPLAQLERMGALKQLSLMLSRLQRDGVEASPLPVAEIVPILRLLAQLAVPGVVAGEVAEERRRVLHVAAAILRRLLHGPGMGHYRALALQRGAAPEKIAEHYRLLCRIYWFDEAIDRGHRSRERILEAYKVLSSPVSGARLPEQRARRGGASMFAGGKRVVLLLLPLLLLLFGALLYLSGREREGFVLERAGSAPTEKKEVSVVPEDDPEERSYQELEQALEPLHPVEPETASVSASEERGIEERHMTAGMQRSLTYEVLRDEVEEPPLIADAVEPFDQYATPLASEGYFSPSGAVALTGLTAAGFPAGGAFSSAPVAPAGIGLAVIGAPELAVDTLTRKQVRAILLGERVLLSSIDKPLTAVLRQVYGGREQDLFHELVGKTPRQFRIHWAKIRFQGRVFPPELVADDAAVKRAVISNSGTIGIIARGSADESVKVLLHFDG